MRLILAIPDLLAQDPATLAASPSLSRLAQYAGRPTMRRGGLDAWLAGAWFGNDVTGAGGTATVGAGGTAPLSAVGAGGTAPLAALGAGLDPGTSWVLRADPVSLVAGRADVTLDKRIDDLDAGDADAMIAVLNAHFGDDGLRFHAPRPDAWFVTLDLAPDLATTPLSAVRGAIHAFLPSGNDAGRWRRWMSEMQMLLHAHPANVAREARGQVPVTGIWIAEGGRVGREAATPSMQIFAPRGSDGDVARGLARLAERAAREPPQDFAALRTTIDALVMLDLAGNANQAIVEAKWLRPALAALEQGALASLRLLADGNRVAASWNAPRPTWIERLRAQFATRPFALPSLEQDDA